MHSRPSIRIHHRHSEVDEWLTTRREALAKLAGRLVVERFGFAEPEYTVEIYTKSESKAARNIMGGANKATYIDGEGRECIMRRGAHMWNHDLD